MFRALARGVNALAQQASGFGYWLDLSTAVYEDTGYVNSGSAWLDLSTAVYEDTGYVNSGSAWLDLSTATYEDWSPPI